jgi:hypothetical protein
LRKGGTAALQLFLLPRPANAAAVTARERQRARAARPRGGARARAWRREGADRLDKCRGAAHSGGGGPFFARAARAMGRGARARRAHQGGSSSASRTRRRGERKRLLERAQEGASGRG